MQIAIVVIDSFFFFNDTATTEIYTLSLHDALPISRRRFSRPMRWLCFLLLASPPLASAATGQTRSEEHTSELQSRLHLVCRLLLEKKKKKNDHAITYRGNDQMSRKTATLSTTVSDY